MMGGGMLWFGLLMMLFGLFSAWRSRRWVS